MKNRNIQFKPAARVLIPLLLACLGAVFILGTHSGSSQRDLCRSTPLSRGKLGGEIFGVSASHVIIHGHAIVFGNATQLEGVYTGPRRILQERMQSYIRWQLSLVCGQRRRNLRHFRGVPDPDGNTWSVQQP